MRCNDGCRLALLLLLMMGAAGCDSDVWALVHTGGASPAFDAALDAGDAGTWAGVVHGSGFDDYAGLQVYGRIGSTSSEVASATIQPDGSFVLRFTELEVWVDTSILYTYIDVTESGSCDNAGDYVAEAIGFLSFGDGFEIQVTPDDLTASIWGCFRFS